MSITTLAGLSPTHRSAQRRLAARPHRHEGGSSPRLAGVDAYMMASVVCDTALAAVAREQAISTGMPHNYGIVNTITHTHRILYTYYSTFFYLN